MFSRNSLSSDDGWEDLAYDNLSVISFSTSDSEADAASSTSRSEPGELTSPEPRAAQAQAPSSITSTREFDLPIRSAGRPSSCGATAQGFPPPSPVEPTTPAKPAEDPLPPPSSSESNESGHESIHDALGELIDDESRDVNPVFLHKTLLSLREILDDTAHSVSVLPGLANTTRERSLGICSLLSRQVAELIPIVSGYAKAWSSSSYEIPLDPGLRSWLQGVRVKVIGLQVEVQGISRQSTGGPSFSLSYVPSLVNIWRDLDDFEKKMDEFLPIMQVDFNEFETQKMNIPLANPLDTRPPAPTTPIRRSDPIDIPQPASPIRDHQFLPPYSEPHSPQGPSNHVWLLRHELYRLKDIVQQIITRLSDTTGLSNSAAALASDIREQYTRFSNTLGLALSNHSSDWIDSGLSGGLTYAEFLGLDTECIRDFAAQLEVTLKGMREAAEHSNGSWWPAVNSWDNELERLEVLVMVLNATLEPNRD